MEPETTDSLASLLPRKKSELWLRGCPRNVTVVLCSCAFVVALASAAALCVLAQWNRSRESSYESSPAAVVFPAAGLLLFEQPTRDVPQSTVRARVVRRITLAAPYLLERNDRWRLVRVTRRHRRSRPVSGATAGALSRSGNVAFSETPRRSRGNAVLEKVVKNPPAEDGGPVRTIATGGASGAKEPSSQQGSGETEAKNSNETAQVVHHSLRSAIESAPTTASEKPPLATAVPGTSPGARKTVGDKVVNGKELMMAKRRSASFDAARSLPTM